MEEFLEEPLNWGEIFGSQVRLSEIGYKVLNSAGSFIIGRNLSDIVTFLFLISLYSIWSKGRMGSKWDRVTTKTKINQKSRSETTKYQEYFLKKIFRNIFAEFYWLYYGRSIFEDERFTRWKWIWYQLFLRHNTEITVIKKLVVNLEQDFLPENLPLMQSFNKNLKAVNQM